MNLLLALFCILYVEDEAFTFEDLDQPTRGLNLFYQHFARFGLEMHIGKGKEASKTKCVFFPPPGFLIQKLNLSTKNNKRKRKMLAMNTKQESHESRYIKEETTYDSLLETRLVIVKDGLVTFSQHFKYLGSWISFSLREDHDIMKRIAAANASMGAMSRVWDNDNIREMS